MPEVFLGLGANLGNRRAALRSAVAELRLLLTSVRVSALYESAPWGDQDQPAFLNAVLRGHTELAPLDLLDATQAIENQLGRVRSGRRWGPRTIDIDILLYGNDVISDPRLTVPHAHLTERGFVLRPLADIAAGRTIPVNGSLVGELLTTVDTGDVKQIEAASWAD